MDYLDLTIVHVCDERGAGDGSYRVSLRTPGGGQTRHLALRDPPTTKECEAVIPALDEIRRSPSASEHE